MKGYIKFGFFMIMVIPTIGYTDGSYWTCTTRDSEKLEWTAKNAYQKVAINLAFSACKKQSKNPMTCKASIHDCEGFIQGVSTKPFWRCTALDEAGMPWKSIYYVQRDDAALAAKAYCKDNSAVPDTCYINLVTCKNYNDGASL